MRLSLRDFVFSPGISSGHLQTNYSNNQYNNSFLSTNYFKSETFLSRKEQNRWIGWTKEYFERGVKNVIVKVESKYLLSQSNDDGIVTLEFENVDAQGRRVNTYRIELLFNIVFKNEKADIASLEWINITTSNPNPSIKYEVYNRDININGSNTLRNLTEFTLDEEVAFETEEEYKQYFKYFNYTNTHRDVTKRKLSFENIIFSYKTTKTSNRFYKINDEEPILIIKAIGAIDTDITKVFVKDIVDIKRYYRQGCLYTDNSFKGIKKISKKLYLGATEILEDEINNSEKENSGHVRLFKDTIFKQAKYVESDN